MWCPALGGAIGAAGVADVFGCAKAAEAAACEDDGEDGEHELAFGLLCFFRFDWCAAPGLA